MLLKMNPLPRKPKKKLYARANSCIMNKIQEDIP